MNNTRPNLKNRYEVVCNRINYLENIVEKELKIFQKEKEALETLLELYKKDDPIDIERATMATSIQLMFKPLQRYGTSAKILDLLSNGDILSVKQLMELLENTKSAVTCSLHKLYKENRVIRLGDGRYKIAEGVK